MSSQSACAEATLMLTNNEITMHIAKILFMKNWVTKLSWGLSKMGALRGG